MPELPRLQEIAESEKLLKHGGTEEDRKTINIFEPNLFRAQENLCAFPLDRPTFIKHQEPEPLKQFDMFSGGYPIMRH